MSIRFKRFQKLAAGLVALLVMAGPAAQAAPDAEGSSTFVEPQFGAYTATKSYQVFSATNPDNPSPVAGQYTYVYTIANSPGSFVCLIGFDLEAPLGSIGSAGFLPGPGVDPSSTMVGAVGSTDVVEWDFQPDPAGAICPGQTSDQLFVRSAYSPGTVSDNMSSVDGQFALDTSGACVGPFVPPTNNNGEPLPCTIGFWKNRADGKKGTLQWFPNGDFTSVVSAATALSSGIFPDSSSLLTFLGSKGSRPIQERAKQQLAATLLNLAAADLFPDNQKCKLFDGNGITNNACGQNLTIINAVNTAKVNISGDSAAQHEAMECLDDINNGISVHQ